VQAGPRVALVLGAGGVTGGSFHAGVLAALQDAGWDSRRADLIVGTSAGSVVGGLLRAGLPPTDLVNRLTGSPLSVEGRQVLGSAGPSPDPPRPGRFRLPQVTPLAVAGAALRSGSFNPFAVAAATMPEGAARHDYMIDLLDGALDAQWPDRPLWIVAVRQGDGQRVVFGADAGARATVGRAAAASAAVPGLFRPVEIDDHRYIDGGVWSVHNLDLVAGAEPAFDLVIVSAPMARRGRRLPTRPDLATASVIRAQLDREVARLRRRRTTVVVLAPSDEDRFVMGPAPMDPKRRAPVALQIRESMTKRLAGNRLADALAPILG